MNDDRLHTGLRASAESFEIPTGDLERVIERGRHRTRVRRRLTASFTAVALVAGSLAAVRLAGGDDGNEVSAEGFAAQLGDAGIDWSIADATAPLGPIWTSGIVELDGQFYAVSTEPGRARTDQASRRVIWRSDDGIDWTLGSSPASLYLSDLSSSDGRLYAIGTAPASGTPDVLVGWSDGDAWEQRSLPIDTAAMAAKTTRVWVHPDDVASGPGGIVAVATVAVELDVPKLLPDGATAPNGWAITEDGVDVLGPGAPCPEGTTTEWDGAVANEPDAVPGPGRFESAQCAAPDGDPESVRPQDGRGVIARYSWSELGVDGALLDAVLQRPFVFHSPGPDGTFARVDAPVTGRLTGGDTLVQVGDDGFDLVTTRLLGEPGAKKDIQSDVVLLHSPDGRTWTQRASGLSDLQWVVAMGRVNGQLAIAGGGSSGVVYATLGPAGWSTTDLTGVVDNAREPVGITHAAIGPLGVVIGVVVPDGDSARFDVLASRDGTTWSRVPVDDLVTSHAETDGRSRPGIDMIAVQGDRGLITVSVSDPDGKATRRFALVGTPR